MTTPATAPVRLDDLISTVAHAHQDPLDRVTGAVDLAQELDSLADSLIGHFVDQARRGGASWSQIGASMGMSKQAAQQRFVVKDQTTPLDPSQGFSRFADDARAVVVGAQELAREAGNDTIGVAHLVLALVADPDAPAAHCITEAGAALEETRQLAHAGLPGPAGTVPTLIPFDAHAKDALQRGLDHARALGADTVSGAHVLLGVLTAEQGTGVLAALGVSAEAVEATLRAGAKAGD